MFVEHCRGSCERADATAAVRRSQAPAPLPGGTLTVGALAVRLTTIHSPQMPLLAAGPFAMVPGAMLFFRRGIG
jgi:hypothetical protein